jgi:hypothetical protein
MSMPARSANRRQDIDRAYRRFEQTVRHRPGAATIIGTREDPSKKVHLEPEATLSEHVAVIRHEDRISVLSV